jgi:hypothetical protein
MSKNERDLGAWILPQPPEKNQWVSIPKHPGAARKVPFGYKENEEDPDWLDPIPFELEALEKARQYLKQYSYEKVAHWLSKTTGRTITKDGLNKRFKYEVNRRRKATYYRNLARRLYKALSQAKVYEERTGKKSGITVFDTDRYVQLDKQAREFFDANP